MNNQHTLLSTLDQHNLPPGEIANPYIIPPHLLSPGDITSLAVFNFPLDGITDAGRSLIDYAIAHPWKFGIASALILGGILFLTLPIIVGFARLGPVAGSLAARWQSWIGNVVPGSLFSHLQRLTMKGVFENIEKAMIRMGLMVGILPIPSSSGHRNYPGARER